MLLKRRVLLIESLALTSLVSIGFSSWSIIMTAEPEIITGTVNVENIINNNEYVTITSIKQFEYFDTGFIVDGATSETATISADVIIYPLKCKELFPDNEVLSLSATLKYSDDVNSSFGMIDECLQSLTINGNTRTLNIVNNSVTTKISDVDISSDSEIKYTFIYTFSSSGFDFMEEIFPYLDNDNIKFDMNVVLEGG